MQKADFEKIFHLEKIFEKEKISFAYLYWSRARWDFNENSDVDIAFYPDELYNQDILKLQWEISKEMPWYEIQIVNLKKVRNEILKFSVFTEWKLIYQKDVSKRLEQEIPLVMIAKEWMSRHYKNLIKNYVKGNKFTLKN